MASRDHAVGGPTTPNFIYIGPDKAGSSWLHECLLTHPQVFMPVAKDLYFFDRYYDRGLSWYLSQFSDATPTQRVVGEVCQDYLFCSEAPARIEESLGTARFMVTLRDPADRAFSSYLYMLKQGQTPGTFLEALEGRPELIEHGRYATGIERFVDRFGKDQLYVAVFDDLVADPQAFIDALLVWLEIDPMTLSDELLQARLPAGSARSASAGALGSASGGRRPRAGRSQPRGPGQALDHSPEAALPDPRRRQAGHVGGRACSGP